jgi:hypothetical protein
LSITENSSKHEKVDFEWLESELHQAEDIIDQVRECINECKDEISLFFFTKDSVSKKISKMKHSDDDWQDTY